MVQLFRFIELTYLADVERVVSRVLLQDEELVPHPVPLESVEYYVPILDSEWCVCYWMQRNRVQHHGPAAAHPLDQHQHAERCQSTPFPTAPPAHGVGPRRKTKGEKKSMLGDNEAQGIQLWTVCSGVCSLCGKAAETRSSSEIDETDPRRSRC